MLIRPVVSTAMALIALSATLVSCVRADVSQDKLIVQAYDLLMHDDARDAIAVLEPITSSTDGTMPAERKAIAWNILGSAYQDLDRYDKARHCYEQAINLLGKEKSATGDYASVLDNLGSVEMAVGHVHEAENIRKKVQSIYAAVGDHTGLARVSTNLAVMAYLRNDRKAASRYLATALAESRMASGLDDDDIAGLRSVEGWLLLKQKNAAAALPSFQDAMELWTRRHGARSHQVGWALCMRAEVYIAMGDLTRSSSDLEQALSIFAVSPGKDSALYWSTALTLARNMRREGNASQAAPLEVQARSALDDLRGQRCTGCSVSVQALH